MNAAASHDVVVIGAGLAGLNAATLLEAEGVDVLVLEAQARIGGRIHSMRRLGNNAEAGGTYIGAGYERIKATAARHGIRLIDVTPALKFFREQDLVLGAEIIRQAEWPDHPANPFPEGDRTLMPWRYRRALPMRENPLGSPEEWLEPRHAALDISMHDWMRGLGCSDAAIDIGYSRNSTFGDDASDVSALLLLFRAAFSSAQRAFAPKDTLGYTAENGVESIPAAMAASLRRGVRLECPVVAIDHSRDAAVVHRTDGSWPNSNVSRRRAGAGAAVVHCADGSRIRARHVVFAAPFGVLRGIRIDPPLAGLQAEAVDRLRSQAITQVYLRPKTPFWELDGYAPSLFTDSLPGMVAAVRSGTDPSEITHLTAWVTGAHATGLDTLSETDAGRRVIDAITAIRPAARGQLESIGLHSWGGDPWAAGAWALFGPGEVTRYARVMGSPHERIHFCGEHLAVVSRGMEAAMESGERASAEVLSQL